MTEKSKNLLKLLAGDDTFDVLKDLATDMTFNWTTQRPAGRTEFEYLQDCLTRDGKIDGVKAFLREIESYLSL